MKCFASFIVMGVGVGFAAGTAQAGNIFSEDFDGLTAGASLSGQGGWGGPTDVTVEADPGSFGFSGQIANQIGVDDQVTHAVGGLNDTNIMTASFDLRINGDTSYNYFQIDSAASFGVERGNMTLRGADGGTQNFDHNLTGDAIYHMVLTVDPTANAGAGSATVTYAVYTAENTLGAAQTAFSNVQLDLDDADNALSDVSGLILRMHNAGTVAQSDNLSISQVPEPGSLALLGLGGLAILRRRRS